MSDSFISFDDTYNDSNTLDQNNGNDITDTSQQINETHDSDQNGIIKKSLIKSLLNS